jgi:hypothetical protein
MAGKEPQPCDVTENRFRLLFMALRIGNIPINMKKPSVLIFAYNTISLALATALYMAFTMVIIVHRDDLKIFMQAFRLLNSATFILWNYFSVR